MAKKKVNFKNNYKFTDSLILNDATFNDYLLRFKRIALSIFEWVNLPRSMNSQWLEYCLYYDGIASLLKDEKYGFINTKCCSDGMLNIYGLPARLNCYSFEYQTSRKLYTGLTPNLTEAQKRVKENQECILVQNNYDRLSTCSTLELFALRLCEAQRTADVNICAQKTPVVLIVDEKQRLMMENLYNQYNGNQPFIFGDSGQGVPDKIKSISTEAPFIADKIMDYKKEIWNEALTFLGVNNIMIDKKERLVSDEANSNNELINLNLQSFLAPRQEACRQFNEKFGFTGTDKEISVRVRSDLHNIIKNEESIISDYKKEGEEDGKIYNRTSQSVRLLQ